MSIEKVIKEFDKEFKPSNIGRQGANLLLQRMIEEHNKSIKDWLTKTLKTQRQEIIDEIKEIGGNCYKCGKWIPDCILGDACICKKDCSKNEQP